MIPLDGLIAMTGLTIILTKSRLFRPLQNIGYYFRCPMCLGVTVGFCYGLLELETLKQCVYMGFATSLTSYAVACLAHLAGDP